MPYATVTLTDEFDLLRQKRLHLNLPQWSSTRARARAQILISIVKSTLLSRQTRSMTPICGLVKGCQYWYATSSSQPGDQSSVFYLIDIDWRWDQKLLLYFRPPAGGGGSILPATNDSMRKIGDALLDSLH